MLLKTINLLSLPFLKCIGLDSYSSYSYIIVLPIMWYVLGMIDKEKAEKYMFNVGYLVSQKFKHLPHWDKYVEPIFIKQFSLLFVASNALLKGMISDNENVEQMTENLEQISSDIKNDLDN